MEQMEGTTVDLASLLLQVSVEALANMAPDLTPQQQQQARVYAEALVESIQSRLVVVLSTAEGADKQQEAELAAPLVDDEVHNLEEQIRDVSQRVHKLRSTVPTLIHERIAGELRSSRAALGPELGSACNAGCTATGASGGQGADGKENRGVDLDHRQQQQQEGVAAARSNGDGGDATASVQDCSTATSTGAPAAAAGSAVDGMPPGSSGGNDQGVTATRPPHACSDVGRPEEGQQAQQAASDDEEDAKLPQRHSEAAKKLPSLRARLQEALERLQRVITAVELETSRPPPNTVDRVVNQRVYALRRTSRGGGSTPGGNRGSTGASPVSASKEGGQQQIASSARAAPRRSSRRLSDVRPIPFSQP